MNYENYIGLFILFFITIIMGSILSLTVIKIIDNKLSNIEIKFPKISNIDEIKLENMSNIDEIKLYNNFIKKDDKINSNSIKIRHYKDPSELSVLQLHKFKFNSSIKKMTLIDYISWLKLYIYTPMLLNEIHLPNLDKIIKKQKINQKDLDEIKKNL